MFETTTHLLRLEATGNAVLINWAAAIAAARFTRIMFGSLCIRLAATIWQYILSTANIAYEPDRLHTCSRGKKFFKRFGADLYHQRLRLYPALNCGRRMVSVWLDYCPRALATERRGQEDVSPIPAHERLHWMSAELNPKMRGDIENRRIR